MKMLVDANELAVTIGVPAKSVYLYAQKGIIPYVRIGKHLRFDLAAVKAKFGVDGVDCLPLQNEVSNKQILDFEGLAKLLVPKRSLKTEKRSLAPLKRSE